MKQLYALVDEENAKTYKFQVKAISGETYITWEMLSGILKEALYTFAGALTGVLVVSTLLLPNIIGVSVVTLNVLMVDIDLMGLCYFWDIDFNVLVLLSLVMAIGLVVDFSSHMAHRYLHIGKEISRLPPKVVKEKVKQYNIENP